MGPSRSGHSTATDRTAPLVVAIDERAYPDEVQVDVDRWSDLARRALVELGIVGSAELTLTLVDPAAIATLNAEHLGGTGPTDVLSFPIDGAPAGESTADDAGQPHLLGDVVICPEVAATNAPDHAGTLDDELALLVVHGVLHVLGHDHGTQAEARAMRAQEVDLLARLHGPVGVGTEMPIEEAG